MASAEVGSVPSGVGYVEGCPLFSRLAPAETDFGVFLKATERSFPYLYDKNPRRQFALASPIAYTRGKHAPPRRHYLC